MSPKNYLNFDLELSITGDMYRARVLASPAGQAAHDFLLPFSPSELAESIGLPIGFIPLNRFAFPDGNTPLTALNAKTFGARLFAGVWQPEIEGIFRRSLDIANQHDAGLRICLRVTEDAAELAALPWEYLYAPDFGFIALSAQTPVVRYLELATSEKPLAANLPIHILTLISNPVAAFPQLDVEAEWESLQTTLADMQKRGLFVLERLEKPTLTALQARLNQPAPVHILHLIGHGAFDPNTQIGELVLQDDHGNVQIISAEQLSTLLSSCHTLRLVFLNACESGRTARQDSFAGIAQSLVQRGIPAVIAMQYVVADQIAIDLTRQFYRTLAEGYGVDAALAEARKALFLQYEQIDWGSPVIFMRAADGFLFDTLALARIAPCPYPGMRAFTQKEATRFFGRDSEIAELQRRLRHQNFFLVIGPSGSGKSSLILAGLLPALEQNEPGIWHVKQMRPGATPLNNLQLTIGELIDLQTFQVKLLPTPRLLLIVDQLEELFAQAARSEQVNFINAIQALRRINQVAILLAIRADFFPDLMHSALWPLEPSQRLEITPLRGEKLRQAIEQPANRLDVTLESGLVERLLADAANEPGALPLLQETMALLWQQQKRRVLPLSAYTQLGNAERSGLAVAMGNAADATITNFSATQRTIARRILLRLVQFGEGRSDTRRQQSLSQLRVPTDDPLLFAETIQHLTKNRLLTLSGEEDEEDPTVDIAHEMLIVGWPMAQTWVKEKRQAELARRRLEAKAEEWVRLGQGDGGLLDSVELAEAEQWLAGSEANELGYSAILSALLVASHQALVSAAEAKQTLELQRNQAQSRQKKAEQQRKRLLLALLLILVLLGIGYVSVLARREWIRRTIGSPLVMIGAGAAIIGTDDPDASAEEGNLRTITLLSFQIEKYEVSHRQYRTCVQVGKCDGPLVTEFYADPTFIDYAMVNVTAKQAHQYCTWLGRRLPTTVEWERAVRGVTGRLWPWGEASTPKPDFEFPTEPVLVESLPETSTPLPEQVYHLVDNVSEWVVGVDADCNGSSCHNAWDGKSEIIYRMGGSYDTPTVRATQRLSSGSDDYDQSYGFRCVL